MKKFLSCLCFTLIASFQVSVAYADSGHYWQFHSGQAYGYQSKVSPNQKASGVATGDINWVTFVSPADSTLSPGDVMFVVMDTPNRFTNVDKGVFDAVLVQKGQDFGTYIQAMISTGQLISSKTLALQPGTVIWTMVQDARNGVVAGELTKAINAEIYSQFARDNGMAQ